jgi:tetratricopeptide (TPR) repeat protein
VGKEQEGNQVEASGAGAVGIGGDVINSTIIAHIGQMPRPTAPSPSGPPRMLPADLGDFTGRERETKELTAALRRADGSRTAVICGMGGAGKSALAARVAHRVVDEYPDGQVTVDLRGIRGEPKPAVIAMQEIAAAFDRTVQLPPEPDAASIEYRRLLGGKRVLLLLDDAADEAQMRPLLSLGPPAGFVVTSRRRLVLPGQHRVTLDEMSQAEARDLLCRIVGRDRATDAELNSVAAQCRRLPLALRVAGTFLDKHENWSAAKYIAALQRERARLRIEGDKDLDVEAVLGFSAARLAASERALAERWQMLSVFPASFDQPAAAAAWGIKDEDEALRDLGLLLGQSLLIYDKASNRYQLHDLMRPIAKKAFAYGAAVDADSSGSEERLNTASYRHAMYYREVLYAAEQHYLLGGSGVTQGLALFDQERAHIEVGQAWATERQALDDHAARLSIEYSVIGPNVLALRLHLEHRTAWSTMAIAAARQLRDSGSEVIALCSLGNAYGAQGKNWQAIQEYDKSLTIARKIGHTQGEISALGGLGNVYVKLGTPRRGIKYLREALDAARGSRDRRKEE